MCEKLVQEIMTRKRKHKPPSKTSPSTSDGHTEVCNKDMEDASACSNDGSGAEQKRLRISLGSSSGSFAASPASDEHAWTNIAHELRPFISTNTEHFIHELRVFLGTPFTLCTFDRSVRYPPTSALAARRLASAR
jgi:hypothetical protein